MSLNQTARMLAATAIQDYRRDCPDCFEGRNEWGRHCDTCGGAGFYMADEPAEPESASVIRASTAEERAFAISMAMAQIERRCAGEVK